MKKKRIYKATWFIWTRETRWPIAAQSVSTPGNGERNFLPSVRSRYSEEWWKENVTQKICSYHSGGYVEFYILGYNAIQSRCVWTTQRYIPEDRTLHTQNSDLL
jgi:hypothetical protein